MFSKRCTQRSWFQLPSWSEEPGRSEKARQWDCCFFTDDWVRGHDNVPGTVTMLPLSASTFCLLITSSGSLKMISVQQAGPCSPYSSIKERTDKYCFIQCIRQCATRKIESMLVILREFNIGFWLHRYLMNERQKKKREHWDNTATTESSYHFWYL